MSFSNGLGHHHGGHHHGGHHGGGGFFRPSMMIPQYEPTTIEVITTGDDVCTACRAKTVTGPACDRCPGIKYAGYGLDGGLPSWVPLAGLALVTYLILK